MNEVQYRQATPADDGGIRSLLGRSYPDNVKAAAPFTRWQYWANPFGPTVAAIGVADGRIVAHWAAVRVPLRVDGALVAGAKGVDIATDPAWRGRGLFAGVGQQLMAACREANIAAVLSHPNPDSARGLERAGGKPVGHVAAYVRPLDDRWVAQRFHLPQAVATALHRRLSRESEGDTAQVVPLLPPDLDGLWERVQPSVPHGIVRDSSWWRWRYVNRPSAPYTFVTARRGGQLTGLAAVTVAERFGGAFGLVLEFLAADRDAARGLTSGLSVAAAERGAVGLAQVAIPGSPVAGLIAAAGFNRLPKLLEPRPLRFYVTVPEGESTGLAGASWNMQWGDLDHL